MDRCPKCGHESLVYDPRTKLAMCLRIWECQYKKGVHGRQDYSKRFEDAEKNMAHRLSFPHEPADV